MNSELVATLVPQWIQMLDTTGQWLVGCLLAACVWLVASFFRLQKARETVASEREFLQRKSHEDSTLLARKSAALERAMADIAEMRGALDRAQEDAERMRQIQKESLVSALTLEDCLKKQKTRTAEIEARLTQKTKELQDSRESLLNAETNAKKLQAVLQTMGDEREQSKQSDLRTKQRFEEMNATIARLTENATRDEARIESLTAALSEANDRLVACVGGLPSKPTRPMTLSMLTKDESELPVAYEFSSPPDDSPTVSIAPEIPTTESPKTPLRTIPVRHG